MKNTNTTNNAARDAGHGLPQKYRTFFSHGFLRVKRWDETRGEYVQIGSFAGPDAARRANERIAEDSAAIARANGGAQ